MYMYFELLIVLFNTLTKEYVLQLLCISDELYNTYIKLQSQETGKHR